MLPGGCLRDRGKLDEDGPKLNSLFGVPVPISEAVDDGCPKSKVAMSQGTPILWKNQINCIFVSKKQWGFISMLH